MFETFEFETLTPVMASALLGIILGCIYGVLAQRSAFCLRRGLVGSWQDCLPALGVWLTGFAFAIIGTRLAVISGVISFADHRFLSPEVPVLAIVLGGALFGTGMVLAGGCGSRLTVLTGSGNLRSLLVMAVFAITAHAALKGSLAPVRELLISITIGFGETTGLTALPGQELWPFTLACAALILSLRSGAAITHLAMAAVIGLLVAAGWVGTGFVFLDEFDPIPHQSLSYTGPMADGLFWIIASTAIPAGFGAGLVGGTLVGSAISAVAGGDFRWQSFEQPRQTGRYLAGGVMMGLGGVLAGGCTVGAGLSGVSTSSFAAILALSSIAVSIRAAGTWLTPPRTV